MVEENACMVASNRPNLLSVSISGPEALTMGESGTWCASINNCTGIQNRFWETSTNGWNYNFAGSGNCITRQLNSNELYIKLTVSCTDGQTVTAFHTVQAEDPDNPFFISTDNPDINQIEEVMDYSEIDKPSFGSKIIAYPNPTNKVLNVVFNGKEGTRTEVLLIDMVGKSYKIWSSPFEDSIQNTVSIPIKSYPPGLYILTVINGADIRSQKILIQNDKS